MDAIKSDTTDCVLYSEYISFGVLALWLLQSVTWTLTAMHRPQDALYVNLLLSNYTVR